MAATTALRSNPPVRALYERLRHKGKRHTLAIIAAIPFTANPYTRLLASLRGQPQQRGAVPTLDS